MYNEYQTEASMLERERRETIQRLLDLRSFVAIRDIVEATTSSEATIRRLFIEMEEEGLLRRLRGGVELIRPRDAETRREESLDSRIVLNQEKKRRIARRAASVIQEGDTIFIDGGSTTYHLAEFLTGMNVTVVTNSFAIAEHLLGHSRCKVILPEGTVNRESKLILNNLSADPFANYHANRVFMGIEGITESALTNSEPLLIQTERSMIEHSHELVILADGSKFGRIGSLTLCPVERAKRIVTTTDANAELLNALREKGIEIILV